MLKNQWAQSVLSLLAAGGFFALAGFMPNAAATLNMVAAGLMGLALGRPIPTPGSGPLPGPTERNLETPPPAQPKDGAQ